jgi:formate dehydrogenase maturation protein FdhE
VFPEGDAWLSAASACSHLESLVGRSDIIISSQILRAYVHAAIGRWPALDQVIEEVLTQIREGADRDQPRHQCPACGTRPPVRRTSSQWAEQGACPCLGRY